MAQDYYQVLGVERDATAQEVKKAYRKKARELHPDHNPSEEAAEQFKTVTHAYEVLSNTEKRRNYDATGHEDGRRAGFGGAGAGGGFGGFSDIFETFFGGGGGGGPMSRARRGQDALIATHIDLEDAVFGTEQTIDVETAVRCDRCDGAAMEPGTHPETCTTCRGAGQISRPVDSILGRMMTTEACPTCRGFGDVITDPCGKCSGQGRVRERVSFTVKIPAGVRDGTRIQLAGRGEAGVAGGPNGDLYLEIRVRDHDVFTREGDNLHATMAVPMTAAALGTKIKVETFDGEETFTVEPGTQSGHVITMKGLGAHRLQGSGRGDMKIMLNVTTPTKLNDEQRELMTQLAELRAEDVANGEIESRSFFSRLKTGFDNMFSHDES
ncbi:MAG: molecular chaperone DnaJ [Yaniella sp.]|uniref:molecular chaperone DnaJ n=1 Tax=Yaniella sp. TaxID=2773929 RepID=UPI0017A49DCB|nr:molecular chaperone DnaJ [Yaniella sp.]NLZ97587.1 molecular chaperone DnaJ [Micrococcus sp.]MDN5730549.1 molecular chaperone DnaJ [Yaniella sp.]MDN5742016.1 molecular chaperone DnaJ [Yaniella sp.]MDN5814672.1 molecular chaperone DnaJ [Yaniella sp.]MDN5817058.1 molecular chaperone DnaJ [Yaniella sp.]